MASKTKIMVFRMRELIYTGIFIALGIVLIILLIFMFKSAPAAVQGNLTKTETAKSTTAKYTAGVYTTPITLNDNAIDVEVTVDADHINSIRLVNLSETVTTMYPLVQPALEEIAAQIYETQSVDDITYSEDSKYTSQILLAAVREALTLAEGMLPEK